MYIHSKSNKRRPTHFVFVAETNYQVGKNRFIFFFLHKSFVLKPDITMTYSRASDLKVNDPLSGLFPAHTSLFF